MVTGASTADLALILVDARKGVLEQTRRHAFLSTLLGIPHLVLCVNKMDLVDWSQERFEEIKDEFGQFATKLDVHDLTFIPVSALKGDNIVTRTENMPWYEGSSLLHHLEDVHIASDRNLIDARLPVQYVIRPQRQTDSDLHDFRGYAGTVAAASSSRATRWSRCRRASPRRSPRSGGPAGRRSRRPSHRPRCAYSWPTTSTSAAATPCAGRTIDRSSARRSTR